MNKHPVEALFLEECQANQGETLVLVDFDGEIIARMQDAHSLETQSENGNRIAACVNACAGIPTEALEAVGKGEITLLDALAWENHKS